MAHPDYSFRIAILKNEEGVPLQKNNEDTRYLEWVDGAHLVYLFQCDVCYFRNIKLRSSINGDPADDKLLAFIRRSNLDIIWSREPKTIEGYRTAYNKSIKADTYLGLDPSFPRQGPWDAADKMGFRVALDMLVVLR